MLSKRREREREVDASRTLDESSRRGPQTRERWGRERERLGRSISRASAEEMNEISVGGIESDERRRTTGRVARGGRESVWDSDCWEDSGGEAEKQEMRERCV